MKLHFPAAIGVALLLAVITALPRAHAGSTTLTPLADAYVQDGTYAANNYGKSSSLLVKTDTITYDRDTYLKFDLSTVSNISSATLQLYGALNWSGSTPSRVTTTVYAVPNTSWAEYGVTWNNRPPLGSALSSVTVIGTTNSWYNLDVTSYIQAQKAAGANTVSLALHIPAQGSQYIQFRSKEAGSNIPQLVISSAAAAATPPAAPTALSAKAASSSQINLSWTDNASNESGFYVERSPDGVSFSQIGTTGANATTYSDAGLTPATSYTYRVRAYNSAGTSAYSNNATATTTAVTVASLTLNPASVLGGTSDAGTVTLSSAAPAGGCAVGLSDDQAVAKVPASVTVAAGATSANFTITTSLPAASTNVNVSAALSGVTKTAVLTVTPLAVSSVSLNPSSVTGGTSSTATVTMNGAVPAGGAVVTLASNQTTAATVPASVSLAAGITNATFTVSTSAVATSTTATITATCGTSSQSAVLTVQAPPSLSSITISPSSVIGGNSDTGTVTLSGAAPAAGCAVNLSDDQAVAKVPASVTVAAGTTSANFTITTSRPAVSTGVNVSAALNAVTKTSLLTVMPLAVSSVSLNPSSVTGGTSSTATVTMNGAVPAGGAVVTLASNQTTAATVPASVSLAAGVTSATFTVSTSAVATSTTATITATCGTSSQSAALTVTPAAALAGWYAAPNGSSSNAGTASSPWDLATAVKGGPNGSSVKPGSTIWVRGGTYLNHYGISMNGTAAAPIIIRNSPGERVILDQNGYAAPALTFLDSGCSYVWVWGLEFTNSETTRITSTSGSFPGIARQDNLINIYAPYCKLINCVAHDGGTCIGIWQGAVGSELYGNVTYNNGWIAPDRGHGHGIYTQNIAPSIRSISEHIDFNDFDVGLHGYGEDAASQAVQNTHVTGYVGFNSGSWVAAYLGDVSRATNFLIGTADGACSGINVQYCYTYEPAGCSGHNFQVGFEPLAPIGGNVDVTVENSYFAGSADTFRLWYWQQAKVDHNVIFARQSTPTNDAEYAVDLETTNGLVPPLYAWDHNTYYATTDLHSGVYKPFTCSGVNPSGVSYIDYPTWKAGTGFDANSTFVGNGGAAPSGTQVFVRPNAYEAGRAHVIVYNWPKSSSVSVDLSTTGLANGQNFEIRNTQNYFGSPVLSGTYSSASPVVNLPMTDLTVTAPVGLSGYTNPSTLPEFGAFVVLPR